MITLNTINISDALKNINLIRSLKRLCLSRNSGLKYELNKLKELSKKKEPTGKIIMAMDDSKKIVGWALVSAERFRYNPRGNYTFQIYVSRAIRKQKVGSKLILKGINLAKKENKKLFVIPWNMASASFFVKYYGDTVINYWMAGGKFNMEDVDP